MLRAYCIHIIYNNIYVYIIVASIYLNKYSNYIFAASFILHYGHCVQCNAIDYMYLINRLENACK